VTDTAEVEAAVAEIARVLRADGGDLVLVDVDDGTARVRVRVVLDDASCADCVLPPDQLRATLAASLRRRVPEELELVVDDPRR
jgi:Fe-S cluster biogenesis protein NfuA